MKRQGPLPFLFLAPLKDKKKRALPLVRLGRELSFSNLLLRGGFDKVR
jgi:hypothetical protein